MSGTLGDQGNRLLEESKRILHRDVSGALNDGDFNLAVRRAQEVVELALKGALNLMCTEYPRLHDVAPLFCQQVQEKREDSDLEILTKIREISLWLAQARGPALYLEQDYEVQEADRAFADAGFVIKEIEALLTPDNESPPGEET